ncbi:MAG: dockerin type I domain-containing protein [Coprobacillus sp.]
MKRVTNVFICFIVTITTVFGFNVNEVAAANGLKVHFINVGGADSILIECNGEVALIDGGYATNAMRYTDESLLGIVDQTISKKLSNTTNKDALMEELKLVLTEHPENDVVNYLKKQGITKIDLLISTHPHQDHVSGLLSVLCNFKVSNIVMSSYKYDTSYAQFFDALVQEMATNKTANVVVPNEGDTFKIGGDNGAIFKNLTNPADTYNTGDSGNDVNNYSLVMRMDYGKRSFLLTGDVQRAAQAKLLQKYSKEINVDILKQPHHGYSNMDEGYQNPMNSGNYDFTKVVDADLTVISCDDITPTQKVLNDAAHSNVYTTYSLGDIVMSCDGKKVDIQYKDSTVYAFYTGDINGDGKITPTDYVQVRRQLLGTMNLTGFARTSADVNGDGSVTPSDYVLIRRHLLGTYTIQ